MEVMSRLLFLLVFVFFIFLIIGLIRPTTFSRFLRGEVTRKKTTKIFTIATVVSFVLFFIAVVNTPDTEKRKSRSKPAAENTSNQVKQPNSAEKSAKEIKPSEEKKIPPTNNQEVSTDETRKTGLKYYTGDGVKQDYQEALRLFRKAADQGDASAQYNVGLMYDDGTGIAQNHAEALKWYKKAADQGDTDAQAAIKNSSIEKTPQGVSVQPTPGPTPSNSQISKENQPWETRSLGWFSGNYKFKDGVAKYELVFQREQRDSMMNRSHKDWQDMENCASDKISSIIYKMVQNKSVERIELTCFLEKENLVDKYGNRVESKRELMGTLVRNKAEIDEIRKYVDEDSYVRGGAYLGGKRLMTDSRGNLTKLSSTGAIKCP
jgi:hypothetical protein